MDYTIRPTSKSVPKPKKGSNIKSPTKSRFEKLLHNLKGQRKKDHQRAVNVSVTKGVIM
jgi:hypothetical protein